MVKRVRAHAWLAGLFAGAAASCNVPEPPPSTGGVTFGDAGASDEGGARSCGRGVVIVESDYRSTNIVVSKLDGTTLSGSFISSGATKPGLSLALSGDVEVPLLAPRSKRLVLLDRFGTNVITWMNVDTAGVLAQLPVGQGFESNPQDYIEVDETRAFVSRYGSNIAPGTEPFDEGGDLLIVDTSMPSIVGRIAMPEDDARLLPCPGKMAPVGDDVVVTLERWSRDFSTVGEGRFVGVSPRTNAVEWTVDVAGLAACGRVAVSPTGQRLAIACSGAFDFDSKRFDTSRSDVVLFDATTRPPVELQRFGLATRIDAGIQPALVFADEHVLVGLTYGGNAMPGDGAFTLDVDDGTVTSLFQATKAVVLGGLLCSPQCGDVCLLGDAETNSLHRWKAGAPGRLESLGDVAIESIVGLPPRSIGGI